MVTLAVLAIPAMSSAQCPDGRPPESCARPQRATPPPQNVRARQIVLLPFRNVTRTPANDWLVTGAPLLLGEILGQYRDLNVVPEPRLTAARRRLGISSDSVPDEAQRRRIAEETGGWTSITGSVLALGNTLRISADAFDAASGSVLVHASAEAPAGSDIRPVFDRLALQLLQPAGVSQSGIPTDVVALTTRSIDAYRAYTQGIALMQRGAYQRAEAAFRDAVRRDSNFAIAWVKLGTVAIQAHGMADLLNPFGTVAMAVERAARSTAQLPPRTAAGVRAIRLLFHGDIAQSREIADSLVATDPEDIDARQWAASVNVFDSRLDSAGHRRGSLNASIAQSKWVLARDPGRQEVYFIPALIYGFSAGFFGGTIGGRWRPASSFIAELTTPADVSFTAVVGDSITLVPDSVFTQWPAAERRAAKQRAIDAGRFWTQQWMAASPTNGDAHFWASRFEELAGDYQKSLVEFERAIALGAESNFENTRGRRLYLYEMTGRYVEAEALADSIIAAGAMRAPRPFNSWMDRSRNVIPAVLLRSKQWDRAIANAPSDSTRSPCSALEFEMTGRNVVIPVAELRRITDTVVANYGQVLRSSARSCAPLWARGMVYDSAQSARPTAARRMVEIADSLHRAGDDSTAYGTLFAASSVDRASQKRLSDLPWVDSIGRRFDVGPRFAPGTAIVEADSLVVTLRLLGAEPVTLEPPGIASARGIMFSTAAAPPDSISSFLFVLHSSVPGVAPTYGSLAQFAASYDDFAVRASRKGKTLATGRPRVTAVADGLRIVIKGDYVTALRTAHPSTGRLRVTCLVTSAGLCTAQDITIDYR